MPKIYEPFDFDEIPQYVDDDLKKTYISSMIDLTKEDKTSVNVYIILALGFLGYIFTQNTFATLKSTLLLKIVLLIGSICLILSSVCFFWYWRKIHKCQINLTGCILTLNVKKAMSLWTSTWSENKQLFKLGLFLICFGTGIISLCLLIGYIFL